MPCLEVAVNGERRCVAGTDHVAMLVASVTLGGLDDATDRDRTALSVHGMSGDRHTQYYWGKEKLALKPGDVITIRVVDSMVADEPIPFPTPPNVIKARELLVELRQRRIASPHSLSGLDLSTLEQRTRSSVMSLSIWFALLLGALALWWFFAS